MEAHDGMYEVLARSTRGLSTALGYRDMMTRLHSDRVCELALAIGGACGLTREELSVLRLSAAFHDIGKIGIPDHILMKSGRLEQSEWEAMKLHAEIGEKILRSMGFPGCEAAAAAIRWHHEHYNGGGYPDGLSGKDIPISSRIISLADSYDAMAVTRSYHTGRKHRAILDILHGEAGTKHDPELMPLFVRVIEASPHKAA